MRLVLRHQTNDLDLKESVAEISLQAGFLDLAVKSFQGVIRADPQRKHLNKKIGIGLIQRRGTHGRHPHSGSSGEHLPPPKKKCPDIELLLTISRAYLAIKMPIRADKWVVRALSLDPQNSDAREILRQCT